jgi:hypothetical protein
MSLEAIEQWLERASFPELVTIFSWCVLACALVNWLVKRFSRNPARRWSQFWRLAGLFGPGILFVVWCPYSVLSLSPEVSEIRFWAVFAAWIAWPILCYRIGLGDGRQEIQRKLDAVYDKLGGSKQVTPDTIGADKISLALTPYAML